MFTRVNAQEYQLYLQSMYKEWVSETNTHGKSVRQIAFVKNALFILCKKMIATVKQDPLRIKSVKDPRKKFTMLAKSFTVILILLLTLKIIFFQLWYKNSASFFLHNYRDSSLLCKRPLGFYHVSSLSSKTPTTPSKQPSYTAMIII